MLRGVVDDDERAARDRRGEPSRTVCQERKRESEAKKRRQRQREREKRERERKRERYKRVVRTKTRTRTSEDRRGGLSPIAQT